MKRVAFLFIVLIMSACGSHDRTGGRIISVSIAPFGYFTEQIAGDNFSVNVMVPAGANPHIYEPYPNQIDRLRRSEAYICNGYLGFEMTWMDRFSEINKSMKMLNLGESIETIENDHHHDGEHLERADPHYWVSPKCALRMAESVRDFLSELDPANSQEYDNNYRELVIKISRLDSMARELTSIEGNRTFMIYHPNLAYLARDYGLKEIAVENEGKEPSPSYLRELTDMARQEKIKMILIQREYDPRNVRALADETGGRVELIDPLSGDWYSSTSEIIRLLKTGFEEALK
ncbi:MAG: zinc ABC transporter substrate-binding protein [Bacteroidota bacterium]|nr:zinc ABC transporter substrate-binding protein [Bacteroidota bacterium]